MIIFLIIFVIGNSYYPLTTCWSEKYLEFSFLYRVFYYMVSFTFKRAFYYSPFSATTGAIIASGLGYNGVKKEDNGEEVH